MRNLIIPAVLALLTATQASADLANYHWTNSITKARFYHLDDCKKAGAKRLSQGDNIKMTTTVESSENYRKYKTRNWQLFHGWKTQGEFTCVRTHN